LTARTNAVFLATKAFCANPSQESLLALFRAVNDVEAKKCHCIVGESRHSFLRRGNRWIENAGPSGLCDVITISTLIPHDFQKMLTKAGPTFWTFTQKMEATHRPDNSLCTPPDAKNPFNAWTAPIEGTLTLKWDAPRRPGTHAQGTDKKQTVKNQRRELEEVAHRHGWTIVSVFKDEGISGAKGREQRPGFDALLKGVTRKDFDLIASWSVDRLGRSLQHLVTVLEKLKAKNVDLYIHQQGIDTSTPAGRMIYQVSGVFAEFERAMIVERVKAGLKRARAEGKKLGRPKISIDVEHRIREQLALGLGIRKVARLIPCGTGTVQRVKATQTKASA
jgi:DNA invertase Pin-like site-specific DNA recombinase